MLLEVLPLANCTGEPWLLEEPQGHGLKAKGSTCSQLVGPITLRVSPQNPHAGAPAANGAATWRGDNFRLSASPALLYASLGRYPQPQKATLAKLYEALGNNPSDSVPGSGREAEEVLLCRPLKL